MFTKFPEILACNPRVPKMLENLLPAEDAGFVKQSQAGDEAEPLPALGPLFQPRPRFLRRKMAESSHIWWSFPHSQSFTTLSVS